MKRFWAKVEKARDCWEWVGHRAHGRYGAINIDGKVLAAHRVSWTLHYGDIPDGMRVLHKCDNPPCVRPSHLFLGTQRDNIADMVRKGRSAKCGFAAINNRGAKNANAKFAESDIRQIRKLYRAGEKQAALAQKFNTTQSNISLIVNKVSWK